MNYILHWLVNVWLYINCIVFEYGLLCSKYYAIAIVTVKLSTWWHHQMETFTALLAICAGHSPVPDEFPHKGQWRGALMFSLICAWINGWVNSHEAGKMRRHCAHYDVIVISVWSSMDSHTFRPCVLWDRMTSSLPWMTNRSADLPEWWSWKTLYGLMKS